MSSDFYRYAGLPAQPPESSWPFEKELQRPVHAPRKLVAHKAVRNELDLRRGIHLELNFPDPDNLLQTAYADFRFFLKSIQLSANGPCPVITARSRTSIVEEYRIETRKDGIVISAGDTEGIRRGLIRLEDEILSMGKYSLPLGVTVRKPVIRTRISRCFYGPINRPPKCKDELADDMDYYPEEYLNRLAHDGVNGLWLTIHFFQTVPSRIIPEYGRNAVPRLEKLRRTVAKCARYGIRIYPFCIEPAAFNWPHAEVQAAAKSHPELKGHNQAFCTSTAKGQAYLEEAARTLFTEVPGLGGLIIIPVGERLTHCYSSRIPGSYYSTPNTCPRCAPRRPWEVLAATLSAMARGMHAVNPKAEFIAWPYGQFICWGAENSVKAAGHMPAGVILQHNFETGGQNRQMGKWRPTWDYWLSYVGPSDFFADCAKAAVRHGTRVSAKLQVGCSHEVATTQVVPVPGLLYRKYRRMHRLGVSAAMHSWYFGAYPSLMTKAAGELSFAPFPRREKDFLFALAQRDWGRHAAAIVKAWQCFQKGYSQYPTAHIFGYYGPMHDGPVWPLYLVPQRLPLAPTWQIGYPPSGDYIAECVTNGFTLEEKVILCRRMAENWDRGVRIMQGLKRYFRANRERMKDIGLAMALGLQFKSGYNILRFYALREKLAEARLPIARRRILKAMRKIVWAELKIDEELLPLAKADSRLGFHSEAEGYKYFPALIRWRMRQLRCLLWKEFPAVARKAGCSEPLFPDYIGEQPAGMSYMCRRLAKAPTLDGKPFRGGWDKLQQAECVHWLRQKFNLERWRKCGYDPHDHLPLPEPARGGRRVFWKAGHDDRALYLGLICRADRDAGDPGVAFKGSELEVFIEPQRTQPRILFTASAAGIIRCIHDDGYIPRSDKAWQAGTYFGQDEWSIVLRIPFQWLGVAGNSAKRKPIRINVVLSMPLPGAGGTALCSWVKTRPAKGRLVWGYLNSAADFGWLYFGVE